MVAAVNDLPLVEPALLSDPLDFFFAEHYRQRKLCNLMEQLATAAALDAPVATGILDFLRHDMVLHVQDEEEDLFPLMRLRCAPADEIERVLSALTAEHAGDRHLSGLVVEGLEAALADGRPPSACPRLREAMVDFVRNQRRHLALENSVVLPLARLRLTADDLVALSARMTRRHGGETAKAKA
ncbi:MAG: hemerythrin domain-containing protein [Kiloniellaceae bacterium]